jgi:hypothetical protein
MLSAYTKPVPWEAIHQQEFVFEDQCWTTCNGGFCCTNNHPDFAFQLIPTHGTTIIYLEEEYQWLSRHGTVPGPHNVGSVPNELIFDFGGPQPLSLVQLPCRLLGLCKGVIDKPLLCKLYPMLPVLAIDGSLEDVCPATIFDLTMGIKGMETPCTVVVKKAKYINRWKAAGSPLDTLRHPYLILYLRAAKHFADMYSQKLRADERLRALTGKDFWRRWELQYLSGQLFDADLLADSIRRTYEQLVSRYGEFLPTPQTAVNRVYANDGN